MGNNLEERADNRVCVAFSGGGTGGHIYPGLAVAAALQKEYPCRIFWIGSSKALDRSIVEEAGIEFFSIPAGKLRRNFSFRNFSDLFKVALGFFAARKILKREKPALLFSKGGFVSVPPCAAAACLGVPVFTHESDFSPGLATRLNARFAAKGSGRIITAYAETARRFSKKIQDKICVLGNPVRAEFKSADPQKGRAFLGADKTERILLVLGGSQGARELNELVASSIDGLTKNYLVVHQTGAGAMSAHLTAEDTEFHREKCQYKPYPYIKEELPHVLAAAELVLARSGAGTVWECAAAGKPMILLPLAGSATRGDQPENAHFFEKAGAALVLPPGKREAADLLEAVNMLAEDDGKREAMAAASARIGNTGGTGNIVRLLIDALKQGVQAERNNGGEV
ncbi:MAG: undecaprenyldiphospho-muramoylpentapeptide beta-N-acetylglucosaminyltransferase [Spirochaetaceae bacterium]|jgi:UDP-N-acetylglucosamine--N-acetylmuramyl-(pentapeptide) pyrophosphoryl-undecaprenol N-acetylglucosamine transferase|nr:undecaprenyldiphospho-muramoylpentapeptide beta-N-acetylglucosaminyltransferase [Spirochaetaceae bacterium]